MTDKSKQVLKSGKRRPKGPTEKELAQDMLIGYMQMAFDCIDTGSVGGDAARRDIMSKQMARVERLFGYDPYSFQRGA